MFLYICLYKIPIVFVEVDIIAPGEMVTELKYASAPRLALY